MFLNEQDVESIREKRVVVVGISLLELTHYHFFFFSFFYRENKKKKRATECDAILRHCESR